MNNPKKGIKYITKLKELGNNFKWFLFTELQDFKLTSDYINFICPGTKKNINNVEDLRAIIGNTLVREFSTKVHDLKAFDLLIDSVMHNIQKKEQDL